MLPMATWCHERIELESLFCKWVTGSFEGGAMGSNEGSLLPLELDLRYQITGLMVRSLEANRSLPWLGSAAQAAGLWHSPEL